MGTAVDTSVGVGWLTASGNGGDVAGTSVGVATIGIDVGEADCDSGVADAAGAAACFGEAGGSGEAALGSISEAAAAASTYARSLCNFRPGQIRFGLVST